MLTYRLLLMTGELPESELSLYKEVLGDSLELYSLFPMDYTTELIGVTNLYCDPSANIISSTFTELLDTIIFDEIIYKTGELPYDMERELLMLSAERGIEYTSKGYYSPEGKSIVVYSNDGFAFADGEKGLPPYPITMIEVSELDVSYEQLTTIYTALSQTQVVVDILAHIATPSSVYFTAIADTSDITRIMNDTTVSGITFYQAVKTLSPAEIIDFYESYGHVPKVINA